MNPGFPLLNQHFQREFAIITCLSAFEPYTPSCFMCLTCLSYAPLPTRLARLLLAPYARYLSTFLGWICSPAEISIFQRLIKAL